MKKVKITEVVLEKYKEELIKDEKSTNTIQKYERDVRHFWKFVGERPIDKFVVMEYKSQLKKDYAITSANSMIASLNSFLRFIGSQDCCVKQFKVQKKTYCSEEKELTKEEYFSLVRTAERMGNERLSLLIQTLCATGVRVGELKYVTVEAVEKGEAIVSCKGKIRKIFFVSALRKKLLKYTRRIGIESGMIFVTKNGNPLDRSNVWREMKDLCDKAGVGSEKVFPHNLRHLFARSFYTIEKDIAKLADILGHSNINTTRIYIMSTGAEHKRYMENMKLVI